MGLVLSEGGAVVSTVPSTLSALRETVTLVQRQIEDATWDNLSHDIDRRGLDDDPEDRLLLIKRARAAVKRNPMARQAVDLLQHYVLGSGVTVKAQNRTIVAKLIDEFISNAENRVTFTSHDAQKELLERAYVDGDVYLVLFVDKDKGLLRIGWLDATRVVDIIPDEENAKMPKWVKAKAKASAFNFKTGEWESGPDARIGEFVYYRWWTNEDDIPKGMPKKSVQEGLVYQIAVDKSGLFGRSKLATAIDWLNAHKGFMEDRATISKAAASVAWKKKRHGSASDIANEVTKLQSSIVGDPRRYETNPTRTTASTVVENQGTSLEWVDTNTGGASADHDERKLRMMAGSGMGGIPNHYFGDEANANLATATAMELPLLKTYEDWQQTLRQAYNEIVQFYLTICHEAGRLGPDDTSARYTEAKTTAQGVMEQPEAQTPPKQEPVGEGPVAQHLLGMAKAMKESAAPGRPMIPYTPAPSDTTVRMIPKPDAEVEEPKEPSTSDPVPWYVDIDFPPIVQKDTFQFMQALEKFAAMLPSEVLEAKKLVVELGLQVFGINDIDKTMERLYPADMVGVLVPPSPKVMGPDGRAQEGVPAFGRPAEGEPKAIAESVADIRRRRLLAAVREAGDAIVASAG